MNIKRVIFGEPMPDKDDPKYKKRYERDFAAGEKFARKTGLSWLVMKTQLFANMHPVAFLIVTFSFVAACLGYNIGLLIRAFNAPDGASKARTPVEQVDSVMSRKTHIAPNSYR